jgi:hypothetical protein
VFPRPLELVNEIIEIMYWTAAVRCRILLLPSVPESRGRRL